MPLGLDLSLLSLKAGPSSHSAPRTRGHKTLLPTHRSVVAEGAANQLQGAPRRDRATITLPNKMHHNLD
jgi:hypothetical protein